MVLRDALILGFIGLGPGLTYIIWQTSRGAISHYHLFFKEERRPTLLLLLGGLTSAFLVYVLLGVPYPMILGLAIGILGGIGIAIITWFWKMSFHAAVSAGCAALFFPESRAIMLGLLCVALIAGIVRLPIKHHRPLEVVGGWLYGLGVTFLFLWLFGGL